MIQSKASGLWIVLKGRAFKAFPLSGSGNAHSFAVFCYRAAGDFYALPGQTFDNHIVGENVVGFFFVGQLFDAVFDGGNRGVLVTGVGSGGRREKVFQFKIPRGVCIYLPLVTRLTVLSCISRASATSRSSSGFINSIPFSKSRADV